MEDLKIHGWKFKKIENGILIESGDNFLHLTCMEDRKKLKNWLNSNL